MRKTHNSSRPRTVSYHRTCQRGYYGKAKTYGQIRFDALFYRREMVRFMEDASHQEVSSSFTTDMEMGAGRSEAWTWSEFVAPFVSGLS